jgi:hypothetical protein
LRQFVDELDEVGYVDHDPTARIDERRVSTSPAK